MTRRENEDVFMAAVVVPWKWHKDYLMKGFMGVDEETNPPCFLNYRNTSTPRGVPTETEYNSQ